MKKGTLETFEEDIKSGTILVDFWASWCPPCQQMEPILKDVEVHNPHVTIIKVDCDTELELVKQCGVESIPTYLLFVDGKLSMKDSGFKSLIDMNKFVSETENW